MADEQRAPEYDRNLLESCANWLDGHKHTVWAKEFGHTGLMETYARDLRAIRERLPAAGVEASHPLKKAAQDVLAVNIASGEDVVCG